ncbi:MAG: ribulose-phosphate 3-epimerase, partial [Clostridia bacterium]|nr:ribulose-phosphate 3-epimerase [Clostridia bacterium]
LDRIRRENNYNFKIEVDGGVNGSNASQIIEAGADMLVSGSFIYKADNKIKAIKQLKG